VASLPLDIEGELTLEDPLGRELRLVAEGGRLVLILPTKALGLRSRALLPDAATRLALSHALAAIDQSLDIRGGGLLVARLDSRQHPGGNFPGRLLGLSPIQLFPLALLRALLFRRRSPGAA